MGERTWARTWCVAAAVSLLALASWEAFLRARDFEPSVSDGHPLWSRTRARASDGDPRTVAFLGSSVIQTAISLDTFSRSTGGAKALQLALTAASPLPVLEDLAADEGFRGLAVVEYAGQMLIDRGWMERVPEEYLAHHAAVEASPFERVEGRLQTFTQAHVVLRQSVLAPGQLWKAARRGRWPEARPVRVTAGREMVIHYETIPRHFFRTDRTNNRLWLERGPLGAADLARVGEQIDRFRTALGALRARGADAAFVMLRCRGPERDVTERRRAELWEEFGRRVEARLVDLADWIDRERLWCPDGAHYERESRALLSAALGDALADLLEARAAG